MKHHSRTWRVFALCVCLFLFGGTVVPGGVHAALPAGGTITHGSGTIGHEEDGVGELTIEQSGSRMIVDWDTFSIGEGAAVHFDQAFGANAVALNRVLGGELSEIMGRLTADGQVFLINPQGVLFGENAHVDVGGLVASTLALNDEDFMRGEYHFTDGAGAGAVTNLGDITAGEGGYVALIAPRVHNDGTITAYLGSVALASGGTVSLDVVRGGLIGVTIEEAVAHALIENFGELSADGGLVLMSVEAQQALLGTVMNQAGQVRARTVENENGRIILSGGASGVAEASGTVDASGQSTGSEGGSIQVTGERVAITGEARLDASGHHGGGTVLIGGSYQGRDATIQHALDTYIGAGTIVDVSATAIGDGGTAIVWSDGVTRFDGLIAARGGASGGDGGFVETSGGFLSLSGLVDATATTGKAGRWLLDPYNVTIQNSGSDSQVDKDGDLWTSSGDDAIVTVGSLEAALAGGTDVTVQTGAEGTQDGNITVLDDITWGSDARLTLLAHRDINVHASITNTGAGHLTLRADSQGSGIGTVTFGTGGTVNFGESSGDVDIFYNPAAEGLIHKYTQAHDYTSDVTVGSGSLTAYMLVNDVHDLQAMNENLSGTYALGRDIDARVTSGWNGGQGFVPIGDGSGRFTGVFDGLGHVIDGLAIDRPTQNYIGLFGIVGADGVVRNVGIIDIDIKGQEYVGGLIGWNSGSIAQAYSMGSVAGEVRVGGLVGLNDGSISQAYNTGSVEGSFVGGLVGWNRGNVSHARSAGSVAGNDQYAGGLVGYSTGSISQAHSTGTVEGNSYVGGLAGYNAGSISQAYSTGAVGGVGSVGGLVGWNNAGSISQAYSTSSVLGNQHVGGLVGRHHDGIISQAYSTGSVEGNSFVGGLVGIASGGTVIESFWDTQSSGMTSGAGETSTWDGFGLHTLDMMTQATFEAKNWDFSASGDWFMIDGETRPFLRSEYSTTIRNAHQLQLMAMDLNASYTLAQDIDLGAALRQNGGMWSERGFAPIGDNDSHFTGIFDGLGHVVDGLMTNRPDDDNIGLFGYVRTGGVVRNVGLTDVDIEGRDVVGGLVGNNWGSISQAYSTGSVQGNDWVGGFVGVNRSNISQAYSTSSVLGNTSVGGFVGSNGGKITQAYSTGSVHGDMDVGGFVGRNHDGKIEQAYSAGSVRGTHRVGGLAGVNAFYGSIQDAYSMGSVEGDEYVGGLVGFNESSAWFWRTYSTGPVSGDEHVGGLIGHDANDGNNQSFYATTDVDGLPINNSGNTEGAFSGNNYGTAKTWDELQRLTTFAVWDSAISAVGGENTVWRIYDGHTAPLLRAFLTTVTVTASDEEKEYDGLVFSGGSHTVSNPNAVLRGTAHYDEASWTNAGTYGWRVGGMYSDQTGYDIVFEEGTLTITPRPITVTADDLSKVYGELDPIELTYTITDGTLVGSDKLTGDLARVFGDDAGDYTIGQGDLTNENNSNYNITFVDGKLTITPRPITVTADDLSKVYGELDPTEFTYVITEGTLVGSDNLTGDLTRASGDDAGAYTIGQGDLTNENNSNYNITFVDGRFTITPRPITVRADDLSKVYGELDPTELTYTIIAGNLVGSDNLVGDLARASGDDAGVYTIGQGDLTNANNSNYEITFEDGTFTITPRPITVTADDLGKVYGELDPAQLTYTVGGAGLVGNDELVGDLTRATGDDAGVYTIGQGSLTNANNSNYDITFEDGTFTITPRPIMVTADDLSKVYGDNAPVRFTYTVGGDGLVGDDELVGNLTRASGDDVGDYTIGQGDLTNDNNSNYIITFVDGWLTITPRPITVTADNLSKVYGELDPTEFTYTVGGGGLVGNDGLVGDLIRASGEDAGSYIIGQGNLTNANNSNYNITFVDGTLTITPRPITVTADDMSKVYGELDPTEFTYTVGGDGLVGDDELVGDLTRASGNDVGSYTIGQGDLTNANNSNYDITFEDGTLTIDPALLHIIVQDADRFYGQPNPEFRVIYDGLVEGDDETTLLGTLMFVTDADVTSSPGSYAVQAEGVTSDNYTIVFVPGTLLIEGGLGNLDWLGDLLHPYMAALSAALGSISDSDISCLMGTGDGGHAHEACALIPPLSDEDGGVEHL